MERSMRRRDREMDRDFAYEVMDESDFGVLSLYSKTRQEVVTIPLSMVREEKSLYFHSATAGEKVEAFYEGNPVKVVFVTGVQVPDLYSDEEVETALEAGDERFLGAKIYTTEFASAIVRGKLTLLTSEEEKLHGLELLCQKFTPTKMKWVHRAAKSSMERVHVYRIDMEEVRSKRKKFGRDREELKFGKREE